MFNKYANQMELPSPGKRSLGERALTALSTVGGAGDGSSTTTTGTATGTSTANLSVPTTPVGWAKAFNFEADL